MNSDVPTLWHCAQVACTQPVPSDYYKRYYDLQLRWNHAHEPDATVRERLGYELRIAELFRRKDPATGSLSPEVRAEIDALREKLKGPGAEEKQEKAEVGEDGVEWYDEEDE
ncbi:MAG TPA: hypothetical protein P5572_21015 [Phycisphaerae bacterium]|nr:hypothetical protein [Phycisphaerales bacterium]HRX87514.1 hypothetical protein [Phycisphaerae bacterium]